MIHIVRIFYCNQIKNKTKMKSYDCRTAVQTIALSEPNATILNVAK